MNKIATSLLISSICVSALSANPFLDNLIINSESVEIKKDSSQVIFLHDVEIKTGFLTIKADTALYDNIKKIVEDNHEISNFIKEAKKPLIIFGQSALKTKSAKYIFESVKSFLKKNHKKIYTDLDIFYSRYAFNQKITITGTNGKSTTAKLLYDILKDQKKDVRLVGNIGNPILLEKKIKKDTLFVIEASSYQLEYSRLFKTNISIILNIAPDHLERHKTINKYVSAKFKLIKNQSKNDIAILNTKNFYIKRELKKKKFAPSILKIEKYNWLCGSFFRLARCCHAILRCAPHGMATDKRSAPAPCTHSPLRSKRAHNTAPTSILHYDKIFSLRENYYLHYERRRALVR